jgi:hypothetical protein
MKRTLEAVQYGTFLHSSFSEGELIVYLLRSEGGKRTHITPAAPGASAPVRALCGIRVRAIAEHRAFTDADPARCPGCASVLARIAALAERKA